MNAIFLYLTQNRTTKLWLWPAHGLLSNKLNWQKMSLYNLMIDLKYSSEKTLKLAVKSVALFNSRSKKVS